MLLYRTDIPEAKIYSFEQTNVIESITFDLITHFLKSNLFNQNVPWQHIQINESLCQRMYNVLIIEL